MSNAPDIISFLLHRYEELLRARNVGRDDFCRLELEKTTAFVRFARSFLQLHRPTLTFHSQDNNLGVKLSNNDYFVISPEPGGDTYNIPPASIEATDAVPITGNAKAPPDCIDYSQARGDGKPINKMATQKPINFAENKGTYDPLTGRMRES